MSSRPRLEFFQGIWTLTDKDRGYSRDLTLPEVSNLLADGFKHIELTLVTASEHPPKKIFRSTLAKRFRKLAKK